MHCVNGGFEGPNESQHILDDLLSEAVLTFHDVHVELAASFVDSRQEFVCYELADFLGRLDGIPVSREKWNQEGNLEVVSGPLKEPKRDGFLICHC